MVLFDDKTIDDDEKIMEREVQSKSKVESESSDIQSPNTMAEWKKSLE